MNETAYKSAFVNVNGVNLHYLDWGGSGETLLFLTGMGSSALLFHPFASRFTDSFRVLALTRRGQGQSDWPDTGYDVDTLVDDIHDFMDSQDIDKAILAGHSLAGLELTHFTEKYPDRVSKLIYIDALYIGKGRLELYEEYPLNDVQPPNPKEEFETIEEYIDYIKYIRPDIASVWNKSWHQSLIKTIEQNAEGKYVEKESPFYSKLIFKTVQGYEPQQPNITVPVLKFVVISELPVPEFCTEEQKRLNTEFMNEVWFPHLKNEIKKFKNDIPQAQVIEILDGHHYCFIAQEELVYEEMRKFL